MESAEDCSCICNCKGKFWFTYVLFNGCCVNALMPRSKPKLKCNFTSLLKAETWFVKYF